MKFAENEIEFRLVKKEGIILMQWSPSKYPKPNEYVPLLNPLQY